MTSPSPLLYDTYYHIYNRGVNRADIFIEERNYDLFLRLYRKHLVPVTDLYPYCFLKNHFHLLLRTRSEEEILKTRKTLTVSPASADRTGQQDRLAHPLGTRYVSDRFSHFFNAYAKTINRAYGRTGSLFQHPFGRVPITSERQWWNVLAYVHQNPQKHGFVKDFRVWKHSSYGTILNGQSKVVNCAEVMKRFGTKEDYVSLHNQWVNDLQAKSLMGNELDI